MVATLKAKKQRNPPIAVPWGMIPPTLRVLYITSRQRTGGWLAEAFAADSASEILLEQVIGSAAGLSRLRDETFDAVLVSHVPGELDAMELIEGYRGGGAEEPIVVLGTQSEQEMSVLCYEVGADAYACVNTTTTRNLIWVVVRAVQRHQLVRENRCLKQGERTRLAREHEEAERLLAQQRTLIIDPESLRDVPAEGPCEAGSERGRGGEQSAAAPAPPVAPLELPDELIAHYRELLRTFVIMGSGNLSGDLGRLAELLVAARLSARQAMQLHLGVLEELIHGLGTRSTRHVMTRADLLVLEIMVHLAEGYRRRYEDLLHPPLQMFLPGFD
jgi:DNA-binding response OmpR family regulator